MFRKLIRWYKRRNLSPETKENLKKIDEAKARWKKVEKGLPYIENAYEKFYSKKLNINNDDK